MEGDDKAVQKPQNATAPAAEPFEDSATPTVATYDCPVCRKAHILDLDRLQVPSQRMFAPFPSPGDDAATAFEIGILAPYLVACEAPGRCKGEV